MVILLLSTAQGQAPALPSPQALLALPDAQSRISQLRAVVTHPESDAMAVARAATAIDVLKALAAANRTDRALVDGFLNAAMSEDTWLREEAWRAARANGLPPSPPTAELLPLDLAIPHAATPTAEAASNLGIDPIQVEARAEYERRRLHMRDLAELRSQTQIPFREPHHTDPSWTVVQDGDYVGPLQFAELVGDGAVVTAIEERDKSVGSLAGAALLGGLTAIVVSSAMYIDDNPNNDGTAFLVGGLGGGLGLGLAIGLPSGHEKRRRWVATHYTLPQAEERVDTYNRTLWQELGLSEPEVDDVEAR